MAEILAYEHWLYDSETETQYDIEGYVDEAGEFLHYLLWVNRDECYSFDDKAPMFKSLETDIRARRLMHG